MQQKIWPFVILYLFKGEVENVFVKKPRLITDNIVFSLSSFPYWNSN